MDSKFTIPHSRHSARRLPAIFILLFSLLFFQLTAQGRDTSWCCALPEDSVSLAGVKKVDFLAEGDSVPDMCRILQDSIVRIGNKILPQFTLPVAQKACDVCRELHGAESKEYSDALQMLGVVYQYTGNIRLSFESYLKADNIIQNQKLDKNNIDYVRLANGLGGMYGQTGNVQKGIEILEENYVRLLNINADTSVTLANNCSILGALYSLIGQYEKAFIKFAQAENYFKQKNDTLNVFYLSFVGNMCISYLFYGDLNKSIFLANKAIENFQKIGLGMHPYCLLAKSYLAMAYMKLHANERGIEILNQDVENVSKNPSLIISNLVALATYSSLLIQSGRFAQADSINILALSALEKVVGINSQAYLVTLGNLGVSYFQQDKIEESINILTKASHGIMMRDAGSLPLYAVLILINSKAGNQKEVRRIVSEALYLQKKGLKFYSVDAQQFLIQSIVSLRGEEDTSLLRQCVDLYFPSISGFIYESFPLLTEKEKLLFLEKQLFGIRAAMSRLFFSPLRNEPATARHFYNTILALKGLLLDDITRSCDAIASRDDSELQKKYSEWKGNRQVLTKQYGLDSLRRQFSPEYLDSLRHRTDEMEISLMHQSAPLRRVLQKIGWQDVRNRLADDEAAVEFVQLRFSHDGFRLSDSILYCALVLRKDWDAPQLVWLFEEYTLSHLLNVVGGNEISEFDYAYSSKEKRLYNLIWKPLEPFLEGTKRVFYAPDGLLHRVAFPGIGCPDGRLLCERYVLQPVGSTRDILSAEDIVIGSAARQPGSAFLAGGINYDAADDCITENRQPGENVSDPDPGLSRKTDSPLSYLPGSLAEVQALDSFLRSKGMNTTLLTGCAASEDNLKRSLSKGPSPRFLHLSTHGKSDPVPMPVSIIRIESQLPDNYLHYSSLAFAGYNRKANKRAPLPGLGDGEMYASEFREFDLSNTELVTLSACESGLGATPGSEGMFGLQRAFRLAGARHVIASVYAVNDVATAEFMKYLYRNLLEGASVRDAWQRTQTQMRHHPAYSHPYYWAGFVLL